MYHSISTDADLVKEKQLLTLHEKMILKGIRNKRIVFILSAYASLAFVFVELWDGYSLKEVILVLTRAKFITYYLGSLFLLLTGFFINYFIQSALPYIKDVKAGMKEIIYFTPGKYKTPFFDDYYLIVPLKKNKLIKINRELYDAIEFSHKACIHASPNARFVFLIEIAGKQMKFDGSRWLVDM